MRRIAVPLSLVLMIPAAAQKVGDVAPDVVWTKTFHFGAMPATKLSDLRGSVVLLEFFSTEVVDCEWPIPRFNEMHARRYDDGLVVLGVTGESAEAVQKFIEKRGLKYPVGIGNWGEYDVRLVPHVYLLDVDGKIVFRGHPDRIDVVQIAQLLAKAKPAYVPKGLEQVFALRRANDFGGAYTLTKQLFARGELSPAAQRQGEIWCKEAEEFVATAMREADEPAVAKDPVALWQRLDPVVNRYAGVAGGAGAQERLEALLADPKQRREIEGAQQVREAEAREADMDFDGAYEIYKACAQSHRSTKAGRAASARYRAMEKEGKLGYDRDCGYCKAAGVACPQHKKKK